MPTQRNTVEGCVELDEAGGAHTLRARRLMYRATIAALAVVVGAAVVDVTTDAAIYGVDSRHVRASGGGYDLVVEYPRVTRPALASPLRITLARDGGFDEPTVDVAITARYIEMWDENGLDPDPDSVTTDGRDIIWTFETPDTAPTMRINYDARIEPAVQAGRGGVVAVLDESGATLVSVHFETRVLP